MLTGSSTVMSPAAPAFRCKFTLVWTLAQLPRVAVSEGLHANMASTKATSGESTSRTSKMQRYMESLVGNSASGLAVAHVLVMRDGGPSPPTSPLARECGRFAQRHWEQIARDFWRGACHRNKVLLSCGSICWRFDTCKPCSLQKHHEGPVPLL